MAAAGPADRQARSVDRGPAGCTRRRGEQFMSLTIHARDLKRYYGSNKAVDGIDLEIPSGRIVGVIGPNGAGKTTALKAILGLTRFEGTLEVLGLDPSKDRDELMQDVCFIADVAVLPRWAKVWQIIELTEKLHPRFSREQCMKYLARTKIRQSAQVRALSK